MPEQHFCKDSELHLFYADIQPHATQILNIRHRIYVKLSFIYLHVIGVTVHRLWMNDRIYMLASVMYSAWLHCTVQSYEHAVSAVTSSLLLLSSGFALRTLPSLLGRSASFFQPQLTTTKLIRCGLQPVCDFVKCDLTVYRLESQNLVQTIDL